MKKSRSKKAVYNTFFELLLQLITALCGFILPRLVLTHFGSSYNGITHSITQFIGCVELLKSGIGSVTRAALYKPLADSNSIGISKIVNATEKFMRKIAIIFLGGVLCFSFVYPFLVQDDVPWFSAFLLVIILSTSTFAQYFFGITYQMVIQADQANYIISIVQIVSTIVNTAISAFLIILGCSIHFVKFGSAIVFVIPPLFYMLYVRKKYHLDKRVKPDNTLISQRWDALGHQIANFINMNTDVMVITVFLGVKEVSVYTIYNLIAYSIRKIINSLTSGITAAFGNMLVRNEQAILYKRYRQFELLMYLITTILFTTTAILFVPFVMIYTKGVTDVNYSRYLFAILLCVANYFACMKLPYETLVYAAGKFKETKNAAFIEAALNIGLSIVLVKIIGLNGIIVGTIAAGLYRTLVYNKYVSENILNYSKWSIIARLFYTIVTACTCYLTTSWINVSSISNYLEWMIYGIVILLITICVSTFWIILMFKKEAITLVQDISKILFKKIQ